MIDCYDVMFKSSRVSDEEKFKLFKYLYNEARNNKITVIKTDKELFIFHCNICSLYEFDVKIDIFNYKIILDNGNIIEYRIKE